MADLYKTLGVSSESSGSSGAGHGYTDATSQIAPANNLFTMLHNYEPNTIEGWLDGQKYRKVELIEIPPNQVQTPDFPAFGQNLEFSYIQS